MSPRPSLDDYVDVATRISVFTEKYPEGSLQRLGDPHVLEVGGKPFVVYTALAYRTPDDVRPGVGTAWEPFPGPTPYTKDSELMNAETAAWGRALVAIGILASSKIASAQEVKARAGDSGVFGPDGDSPPARAPSDKQISYLKRLVTTAKNQGMHTETLRLMLKEAGAPDLKVQEGWMQKLSSEQCSGLIETFKGGVLPTGESDVPSEFVAPEPVAGTDDFPFEEGDAA